MSEQPPDHDQPPATSRVGGARRGWLYGIAVAVVVVIGLIAFAATRGGDDDGGHPGMPGMDMGAPESSAEDLPRRPAKTTSWMLAVS